MSFASRVVRWQAEHGRHDLPWQRDRDPYRVWLSEVMLQQTQVQTVRAYFERFLLRFPDVFALAQASLDEVLALWSGLGYYSRARNLHACALAVVQTHGGVFPRHSEQLQKLPGIGASTAAAIASICFGERIAILDGNVKRVLTRYLAFEHDLAQAQSSKDLWSHAQRLLPSASSAMPAYTQGIMDLGATLCTRRAPGCQRCPLQADCLANRLGHPERFPLKTRKIKRSVQSMWLLLAQTRQGAVWLYKRPETGIWAGLHCFPIFDSEHALSAFVDSLPVEQQIWLPSFTHVLTHKDLHMHPVRVHLAKRIDLAAPGQWALPKQWPSLGLPAPIKALLQDA